MRERWVLKIAGWTAAFAGFWELLRSVSSPWEHPVFTALAAILVLTGTVAAIFWQAASAFKREADSRDEQRGRTEESLRQLAAIVESAKDAVISERLDGTIVTWNAGAENLYGYPASEIVGRNCSILYLPESWEQIRGCWEKVRLGNGVQILRTIGVRKDGSMVAVGLAISPIRTAANVIAGASTIARDISMPIKSEAALREANDKLESTLNELERRNRMLNVFSQMTELLASAGDPEEGYAIVADFAKQVFPSAPGALYVLNASRTLVEAFAAWGGTLASEIAFSPDACWALRLGKAHLSLCDQHSRFCQHLAQLPLNAHSLCVPLVAQGEVFALFCLQLSDGLEDSEGGSPGAEMQAIEREASNFASRIGVSLANLRLREQLRSQSTRDQLTGLFNRSYLDETLQREISRAARKNSALGIIMLDIDHFKEFNDLHGHDAGDLMLREVGAFLSEQSRKQDIACRYGGEEFTLILPDASVADAARRAEQIRTEAGGLHVNYQGQKLGPVNFSIGVSAFPESGSDYTALLKVADRALYRAKVGGRNRVVVC